MKAKECKNLAMVRVTDLCSLERSCSERKSESIE